MNTSIRLLFILALFATLFSPGRAQGELWLRLSFNNVVGNNMPNDGGSSTDYYGEMHNVVIADKDGQCTWKVGQFQSGTSSHVNIRSSTSWKLPSDLADNGLSVAYWVKFDPTSEGYMMLLTTGDNSSTYQPGAIDHSLMFTGSSPYSQRFFTDYTQGSSANEDKLSNGQWYHLVFTYEPIPPSGINYTISEYIDGQFITSWSKGILDVAANDAFLGMTDAALNALTGELDQMDIFDHTLDSTEVTALYQQGPIAVLPKVYYVDMAGNDLNNGLTEVTAFATIQTGLDAALDCDTVLVGPGIYTQDLTFTGRSITLTSIDPNDPNIVNNTIIDGVVQFNGNEGPDCKLMGFNIQKPEVGVVYGNNTHATISHCIISGNELCRTSALRDCDGTISNCLITDNYDLLRCGAPDYVVFGCSGLMKNCTIANNVSGISDWSGDTMTIENCIIYNNVTGPQISIYGGGVLNVSYSNVQGGLAGIQGNGTVNWGLGNIDMDPCFADPNNGDYRLLSVAGRWDTSSSSWVNDALTSRCIDAGNPGSPLGDEPVDSNNVRINMGAYGGNAYASKTPGNWSLLADLNNDGTVDNIDLIEQVDNWLTFATEHPGDLNRDGIVDIEDYALLAGIWLRVLPWSL